MNCRSHRGQSAVEFLLTAPLLFFLFYAMLQLAYLGLTVFGVQRAALAIARESSQSSVSGIESTPGFRILAVKVLSLAPLTALNRRFTWAALLSSDCDIRFDSLNVTVTVHYPLPLWVPGMGGIFGKPLTLSKTPQTIQRLAEIRRIAELLGLKTPALSFPEGPLPSIRWISCSATVFNESTVNNP